MNENISFFDLYIAEAKEHLEILNEALLKLESDPNDKELINTIFRSFHTMKGSTATMNFHKTAEIIHRMEDLLQLMRDDKLKPDSVLIQHLFYCHDFLSKLLDIIIKTGSEAENGYEHIKKELGKFLMNDQQNNACEKSVKFDKAADISNHTINHELIDKIKENMVDGCIPLFIRIFIANDCVYKAVRAWMFFEKLEQVSEIITSWPPKPTEEDFNDGTFSFNSTEIKAIIVSKRSMDDISNHLYSTLNEVDDILIEPISYENNSIVLPSNLDFQNSAEKLSVTEQCPVDTSEIVNRIIEGTQNHFTEDIKTSNSTSQNAAEGGYSQAHIKIDQKNISYIRIPEQKIDNLVDMLGELLIIQSLHKQEIANYMGEENRTDNKIMNNIMRMERITKDIQNISMSLRMVSLKQTLQKLLRVGRDTAIELEKNVNISLSGEDTEIDRSIVEKIQDPLMHLVRNAISHGIEDENQRLHYGKGVQGQIRINAYNKRGNVYIEVSDDGKGLSLNKIYEKAKSAGIIDISKDYTDDEIIKFIYLPGFSTEESVNSISGRGVGMNVVETEITRIGGKIDILNKPGEGCTFILKIPVNLATINGTIIDISGSHYIIPTMNIKQILKPEPEQWINIKGNRQMIKIRNEIIQIIPVDKILGLDNFYSHSNDNIIMVIEMEQKLKALPARAVLGKQEIVVKPLENEFRALNFLSGATILGDGKVSLIFDIESLFKITETY